MRSHGEQYRTPPVTSDNLVEVTYWQEDNAATALLAEQALALWQAPGYRGAPPSGTWRARSWLTSRGTRHERLSCQKRQPGVVETPWGSPWGWWRPRRIRRVSPWQLGDAERAARLLGRRGHKPTQLGSANVVYRVHYDRVAAGARAALGDATFEDQWARGRALPAEQAIAEALAGSRHLAGHTAASVHFIDPIRSRSS